MKYEYKCCLKRRPPYRQRMTEKRLHLTFMKHAVGYVGEGTCLDSNNNFSHNPGLIPLMDCGKRYKLNHTCAFSFRTRMAISSTYFIHLDFFVVGKDLYCLPSNANPSQAMLTEGMKEDGNAWTRVVRNNNLHPDDQPDRHVLFYYGLQVVELNNFAYDISEVFMY